MPQRCGCGGDSASGRQAYAKSVANRKETFSDVSTYERILVAAKVEVAEFGILGLRLDGVARRAHVSMPLIYRHFEDRDELIAVVLGDQYEEWVTSYRSWVDNWLAGATTITLEEFAQLSPKPNQDNARKARTFRLQVLSTSLENPALRERLEGITTEAFTWTQSTVERARPLLPEEDRYFDARIFTHLLFNTMFVFSDLVTGGGVDDSEFTSMVVSLLRASSRDRARERL